MAKTIIQAFEAFQRRLEPLTLSEDDVSTKHKYRRQILTRKLAITDDYLIGSYIKNTQIKPRTDIDVFVFRYLFRIINKRKHV